MKNRKYLIRFWMLILVLALVVSAPLSVSAKIAIPEPTEWIYVNDYAGVLEQSTIEDIVEKNDILYDQTGAQIVITTVDFLDGVPLDDYIVEMFNEWGIGSAEKNNGILLVLAIGEEDYRILQGKGLEKTLSSGVLDDMLYEYLEPDFAVGNYDAGVQKIFDALLERVNMLYDAGDGNDTPPYTGNYEGSHNPSYPIRRSFNPIPLLIFLFVLLIIIGSVFGRVRRSRRMPPVYRRPLYPPPPPPPPGYRRPPPPGGSFWGGFLGGMMANSTRNRPYSGGHSSHRSRGFGGGSSSRGGFSRGGSRGFGGGSSRGGGAGRRK